MLTVVGLGNERGDLTVRGRKAIAGAEILVCRTFLTAVTRGLKRKGAISYDELYETAQDFDLLNQMICEDLTKKSNTANIVYCVQGDGFGDGAVRLLKENGASFEVIAGVSDMGAREPADGVSSYSAYAFVKGAPLIDTSTALVLREIDNVLLAGEVKLALLEAYPPTAECRFSYNGKVYSLTIEDLDKQKRYNFSASVFIPPLKAFNKERYCFADLTALMKRLTAPDGCEWDKVQTHESIRINLIEEAYEAVDAIDSGDLDAMIEETGDVLLQVIFHSDIAARCGEYTFSDVVDRLCSKLITRHTHIFGENKASDAAQALGFWESAKAKEKKQAGLADSLDSIPDMFPSVLKAEKAFKKAVKAGMTVDAESVKAALANAIESRQYGRALFLCVSLAAINKKDAEVELNAVCRQFINECKNKNNIQNAGFLSVLK